MSVTRSESQRTDAYEGNYSKAKAFAFRRSDSVCQFCGYNKAEHAHHWALKYPDGDSVRDKDLTALCTTCHHIATSLRRLYKEGTDRIELQSSLDAAYDDRKRWQDLLSWIRTALSASDRYKDANQGVSINSVMQISQIQFRHLSVELKDEVALNVQEALDDLESYVKKRVRRVTWFVTGGFLILILWINYRYVELILSSLLSRLTF